MIEKSHCMMQWEDLSEYEDFFKFPSKGSTVAQFINENGELEETELARIDENTGELILVCDGKNKVLGLKQYAPFYKQRNHKYVSHQLTTSLIQEHKRLAAIEYQKKATKGVKHHENYRMKIPKQANQQRHFRDQNGMVQ